MTQFMFIIGGILSGALTATTTRVEIANAIQSNSLFPNGQGALSFFVKLALWLAAICLITFFYSEAVQALNKGIASCVVQSVACE